MKIPPVGAEYTMRREGWTDRQDEANSRPNNTVNAADGISGGVLLSSWGSRATFLSLGSRLWLHPQTKRFICWYFTFWWTVMHFEIKPIKVTVALPMERRQQNNTARGAGSTHGNMTHTYGWVGFGGSKHRTTKTRWSINISECCSERRGNSGCISYGVHDRRIVDRFLRGVRDFGLSIFPRPAF